MRKEEYHEKAIRAANKSAILRRCLVRMTTVLVAILCIAGIIFFENDCLGDQNKVEKIEKATFAGGCFWCMQPPFDKLPGVVSTTVGYAGGHKENPNYEEVCSGTTGHAESIEVVYDGSKSSYQEILDVFWRNIDPTTLNRQFADAGDQYRTSIFYHNGEQKKQALASKEALEKSGKYGKPIVTEIVPAPKFYPAEEYHQKYYLKSSIRYKLYRFGSGRDAYLKKMWGEQAKT